MRTPVDVARTVRGLRRGKGDPTMVIDASGVWRATRTPDGVATVHVAPVGDAVEATAWGPGGGWVLDGLDELIGVTDDWTGFEARIPIIENARRRYPGVRIPRTRRVLESAVPVVLEQKVTGKEAHNAYRSLMQMLGERAPGPRPLLAPPPADAIAVLPYFAFHPFGVERKRAETVRGIAARADRLEEAVAMSFGDARTRICAFPGLGEWSAAEIGIQALGDPDAVSVGDYHLKHHVSYALTGEPRGTDERMLELLEPWAGHRAHAVLMILLGGPKPPRSGPRMAILPKY